MINNIFSMFDPSSSYISIAWLILMAPIVLINISTPNVWNSINAINIILINIINNEISLLMSASNNKISSQMMVNIFIATSLMNTIAIIPFNFTPTAHLSISICLSLSIWLSIMMFTLSNSFNITILHLTPIGTPIQLINFIVLIETISSIIRPITLSVRLSANLVAGHLLILLLSNFSNMSIGNITISYIPTILLSSLEIIVAVVQAYVIVILVTLYQNENI